MKRPLRVLHCPYNTGGSPAGIARFERQMGLDSYCVAYSPGPYRYPCDEYLWTELNPLFLKKFIKKLKLFARAALWADVVHFNFGTSLLHYRIYAEDTVFGWFRNRLNFLDVRILRLLGKRIVVTFQGDDARQGDRCRELFKIHFAHNVADGYYTAHSDREKRAMIAGWDRYADAIFALNPDLLHVLPARAKFLPYLHILVDEIEVPAARPRGEEMVVGHAPSHRAVKGTDYLVRAVEELRAEGLPIRLSLVEKLSNQEALKIYETFDVLVDQLLAGWYGGLAVEVMAMAKPVVCYLRPEDLRFIPEKMRRDLPVISASPIEIKEALRRCVDLWRSGELSALGARSRDFARKWHDPRRIIAGMVESYKRA